MCRHGEEIVRIEGVTKEFFCSGGASFNVGRRCGSIIGNLCGCRRGRFRGKSRGRSLIACNDVSLTLRRGETLGIAGESGCGKSTLAKMLLSMESPSKGRILYRGRDLTAMEVEERRRNCKNIQMVFQDSLASFHPRMRIVDIVTEPLVNLKFLKKMNRVAKALELLETVELSGDFLCRYPHTLSGGQIQRVGIARALSVNPEILVCDEATSALDVSVQRNIARLLVDLQRKNGTTMVVISHDVAFINSIAHRLAVMYLGSIMEVMPTSRDVNRVAAHPYTRALLGSIFSTGMDFTKAIESLESEAPSALDIPEGCPFQDRCDRVMDICRFKKPTLAPLRGEKDHLVACHLFDEGGSLWG